MIDLKTELGSFKVCSSWHDLTVEQIDKLKESKGDERELIKTLTTLNDICIDLIDKESLWEQLNFIDVPLIDYVEPFDTIKIGDEEIKIKEDLGQYTYAQKLIATEHMVAMDFVGVICVYAQKKFDHEKIEELKQMLQKENAVLVYSVFKFIKEGFDRLIERDKSLHSEPTYEQIKAGIKNFNVLGEFNTIDMLAMGKPWRYDSILKMDYNTIFNKLLKNKISSNFESKYSEIIRSK